METRRKADEDDLEWKPLRRGWCFGSDQFREEMLQRIGGQLGEHHSGEIKRESAEAKNCDG
jgi:hypothetical protein